MASLFVQYYMQSVLQCVAIDPTEERIAAGDVSGRILIWNAFAHKVPKLQKTPTEKPIVNQAASDSAAPGTAPAAHQSTADVEMSQAPADKAAQGKSSDSDSDSDGEKQPGPAKAAAPAAAQQQGSAAALAHSRAGQVAEQPQHNVVRSRESAAARFARLQQSVESVPLTTVHWHAHPVGALCFSADGTLLLSGGQEAVLVGTGNSSCVTPGILLV